MAAQRVSEWRKLPLSLSELCIDTTLRCGRMSPNILFEQTLQIHTPETWGYTYPGLS